MNNNVLECIVPPLPQLCKLLLPGNPQFLLVIGAAFQFFKSSNKAQRMSFYRAFPSESLKSSSGFLIDMSQAPHRVVLFQSEKYRTRAELELLANV